MAHRRRGRPVSAGGNGVGVGLEFGARVKVGIARYVACTCTRVLCTQVRVAVPAR